MQTCFRRVIYPNIRSVISCACPLGVLCPVAVRVCVQKKQQHTHTHIETETSDDLEQIVQSVCASVFWAISKCTHRISWAKCVNRNHDQPCVRVHVHVE
jgi:hypothetical protein